MRVDLDMQIKHNEAYLKNIDDLRIPLELVNEKDKFTYGHSIRVPSYSVEISKALELAKEVVEEIRRAAVMHDIGKCMVPDRILKKGEHLTKDEWVEMMAHVIHGEHFSKQGDYNFKKIDLPNTIKNHHEFYNGALHVFDDDKQKMVPGGYFGKGESGELFLPVRIITLADCYDAMTSNRPYREAHSKEFAVEEIVKNSGIQFDPNLACVFVKGVLGKSELYDELFEEYFLQLTPPSLDKAINHIKEKEKHFYSN